MKFLHLVIAVVAFMAINSESKPQQPQIIVNDYQDHAPITYHTVPTAQTIKPTAIRVSRGAGTYLYIDLDFLYMTFPVVITLQLRLIYTITRFS